MASVCSGPEFVTSGGILYPAIGGTFRRVANSYKEAVNEGTYGALGTPGRTHIDMELAWVNNTGLPQFVFAEAERGPWFIAVSSPNEAAFRDRLTTAVGVSARAIEPDITSTFDGMFSLYYFSAGSFLSAPDSANSFGSHDRSRFTNMDATMLQAGETISARYRCNLITNTPFRSITGPPNYDARARFARLRIYAAPYRA